MGSSSKVASGVIWSTVMNVINAVYGFISVPILINYFGKAEYGLIGLAMSVNVYMQLMDLGFNSTNVRFFSAWLAKKDYENVKKLFQSSLAFYGCIGIVNSLVLLIITLFSKQLFHLTPEQDTILRDFFIILMLSAIISWYSSCFDQLIRATENVAWIQRRTIIPKLVMIAILFITVYAHLNIVLYFFLTTFALFVIIPLSVKKIRKELPFISFMPKFDWVTLKGIIPYCLNIFSFSLFQFSFYNLRPVFLGIRGNIESVADYRVLNGIISIVSLFGSSFMGALLPSAAKAVAQHNKVAYYKVAYDGTKYISIVLCFCVFGMMTVGKEVLTMYVGESYYYLIPYLNLWLLCTLVVHNNAISSLILSGTDIRAITYNSAIASVAGLVIAWFTIPHYQIGGVVIAFVIYILIQLLFYYFYYWPRKMRINSWRVFSRSFFPYVASGLIINFLIDKTISVSISTFFAFIMKGFLFAILYSIFVLITLTSEDKKYFLSIIKHK
ncbi:MAG: oligosaccharide flippase family protein [Prevotella sp.]|nr:oligosaccharide flippase family protein [Prevotella sp.]